ncbi:hypothetical protein AB0M39_41155 [Streptomyces sp. NPDC051907]|uniref:hypothetical protein n=1 Tax=Streptomyces sp. NPDC051907 TaxID=3155284 RepID=UPI00343B4441
MASTRYIVTPTANYGEKIMSNLKSAKREADLRAKGDRQECLVMTLSTGRISHRAEAPAPVAAAAEFDALLAEVKAEAAAPAPVAKPLKAKAGKGLRAGLGAAAVAGWELLYDKPKQDCQVGRRDGQYALICVEHKTVRPVGRLVEERAVRKAGGWCAECAH